METKELFERFLEVIDELVIEGHKIKIASIETLYKLKEKTYRLLIRMTWLF